MAHILQRPHSSQLPIPVKIQSLTEVKAKKENIPTNRHEYIAMQHVARSSGFRYKNST